MPARVRRRACASRDEEEEDAAERAAGYERGLPDEPGGHDRFCRVAEWTHEDDERRLPDSEAGCADGNKGCQLGERPGHEPRADRCGHPDGMTDVHVDEYECHLNAHRHHKRHRHQTRSLHHQVDRLDQLDELPVPRSRFQIPIASEKHRGHDCSGQRPDCHEMPRVARPSADQEQTTEGNHQQRYRIDDAIDQTGQDNERRSARVPDDDPGAHHVSADHTGQPQICQHALEMRAQRSAGRDTRLPSLQEPPFQCGGHVTAEQHDEGRDQHAAGHLTERVPELSNRNDAQQPGQDGR